MIECARQKVVAHRSEEKRAEFRATQLLAAASQDDIYFAVNVGAPGEQAGLWMGCYALLVKSEERQTSAHVTERQKEDHVR